MEKKKKIVIGLASVTAGGGHNALRDFLYEVLEKDSRFECHSFTHSNTSLDKTNDVVWPKIGKAFDLLYKTIPNEYISISAIQLVKECENFVKEYNPDILLCSYFGIAAAFQLVKKSLKLNYLIINAIPDYGIPSDAYLPTRYLKPDFMMVFDETAKNGIAKKYRFPKERMMLSGYLAKKSFHDLILEAKKTSNDTLVKEIKKELGKTFDINIDPNKRTMIITGGAGGVVNKSFPLLKDVVKYQEKNPGFRENNQILIITGKNEKFYKKIYKFHKKGNFKWSNIIPIPWITHKTYSKIQFLADFPIMESIAPASMNEMIESECGPLLIHHTRGGPETANLKFILKNQIGVYLPKKKDALNLIINGYSKKEKADFEERVKRYKEVRIGRIKKLPDDIADVYNRFASPKRKTDKKRLKFKMDFSMVSPKLWLTIMFLMLPLTVIFGFVQYNKQKNNVIGSKFYQSMIKYISKYLPV